MNSAPMSTELVMLGCAIALVLVQILLQAALSTLDTGISYNMSARDEPGPPPSKYAARAARALRNALETFPLFAALALGLVLTGHTGGQAALGAQIYVWARTIYVPVYILGIPVVRSLVWTASFVGIWMMLKVFLGM